MAPEGQAVFVTWRLAGSILVPPPEVLHNDPNPGKAFVDFDRQLDRSQFGPRWLADTRIASMFAEALRYGAEVRDCYELGAWVVMPNHVHIVISRKEPLPAIVQWLKKTTAFRAGKILGLPAGRFWQREYYDHWIRSRAELGRIEAYIERNPVSAGLAQKPEDWPWSSANPAGNKIASGTTG